MINEGNILLLNSKEPVPADVIILATSSVETSFLCDNSGVIG